MKMLSKSDIIAAKDHKRELVPVPEWGGQVYVKSLTGGERDDYEQGLIGNRSSNKNVNLANARARLCQLSMVDESGKLLFSPAEILVLSQKNAAALDRVFSVAQRLSGITASDLEELAGNSDSGLNDSSTSN